MPVRLPCSSSTRSVEPVGRASLARVHRCVRSTGSVGLLVLGLVVPALTGHQTSLAQTSPPADSGSEAEHPVVSIVLVGDAGTVTRIEQIAHSRSFGRFDTRWQRASRLDVLEILEQKRLTGISLHCYVDLRTPSDTRLYFVDRDTDRFLLRRLPLSVEGNEMDQESLAQIIELSLRALLEEKNVGLSRDEARSLLEPASSPAPPLAPPFSAGPAEPPVGASSVVLDAELHYTLRLHSPEVRWLHGPGLGVLLGDASAAWRRQAGLVLEYAFLQHYAEPAVGVDFGSVMPLLVGQLEHRIFGQGAAGTSWVGGRLGLGLEIVQLSPREGTEAGSIELTKSRTITLPVLALGASGAVPLGPHLALSLLVSTLLDPSRVRYDVRLSTGQESVVTRYRVQPMVSLGLRIR
jgi:hypothetical protein